MTGVRRVAAVISAFTLFALSDAFVATVRSFGELTSDEHDDLFAPEYSPCKQYASRDVELRAATDHSFIKLSYESKHPSYANFLKLDEESHSANFLKLTCSNNEAKQEIVVLHAKSKTVAIAYHKEITTSLSDPEKRHFLTAKHKWGCFNTEKGKFESMLREINGVTLDIEASTLTLSTSNAQLVDVFEELSVSYESNANHDFVSQNAGLVSTSEYTPTSASGRKRRMGRFWRNLWEDIKYGVKAAVEWVEDVIAGASIEGIATMAAVMIGIPVYKDNNVTHIWGWNYNEMSAHASDLVEFSENLTCMDCYSELDMTWTMKIGIVDHEMQYLLVSSEGDIEINTDVFLYGDYEEDEEWSETTMKEALPHLSFEVSGVHMDITVHGEMAFGMKVSEDIDFFMGGFNAIGTLLKGVEYNKSLHDDYNYISKQDIEYSMTGPRTEFDSGDVMFYSRPTLFMDMANIGDFYFGLQPTFDMSLSRDDKSPNCLVHYSPSLKLNTFIGADLTATDWHKKSELGAVQTTLETLAGCVDRADIIRKQATKQELYELKLAEMWWLTLNASVQHPFDSFPTPQPTTNRRMLAVDSAGRAQAASMDTYLNYPDIDLTPRFEATDKWDDRSLEWWGTLSTIGDVCNDWSATCAQHDLPAVRPHVGSLQVSTENSTSTALIAVYRVVVEIIPSLHWDLVDAKMMGNVNCLARHRLTLEQDTYSDDGIRMYDVELLEWYCDTELSDLGLDIETNPEHKAAWECMIMLPEAMTAISLDASLGSIVLFDSGNDWCHVFTLTTKPKYALRVEEIDWDVVEYPSRMWYGIWDCEPLLNEPAKSSELHFTDYDYATGAVEVFMIADRNTSFHMFGTIDLEHMQLTLQSHEDDPYWGADAVHFVGVLDILYDGTMTYAGSIQYDGCSGFLFQGYLNIDQFEVQEEVAATDDKVTEEDEASFMNATTIWVFVVGMALSAILTVGIAAFCGYRKKQQESQGYGILKDDML